MNDPAARYQLVPESAVDRLEIPSLAWPGRSDAAPWSLSARRVVLLVVLAMAIVGAAALTYQLGAAGFSEDEINKLNAIRAYRQFEFSVNAEHPMVMKVLMLGTTVAAEGWNAVAAPRGLPTITEEGALRLPNALAGAAAVFALFLLTESFFGTSVALWAALLLALDVNVIGINRIGKEDSLLLLFLLLASWCYERARSNHLRDGRPDHHWYAAAGAAFGVMLASKYMPHLLGLWALFGLAARDGSTQRASKWFYIAMGLAFLVANPAILLPATWKYILGYVAGKTVTHHGAYFFGQVYPNMMNGTPWGLPWYFYLGFLATKAPLAVLAAMALGIVEMLRRRRERGVVYARVFTVMLLLFGSLMATKFGRYMLPVLVVLDIVAALGVVRALGLVSRIGFVPLRTLAAGVIAILLVGGPALALTETAPHYGLAQNAIGRHLSAPGGIFPNDEIYDAGMREAVLWIAQRAKPGASLASDAPGVVAEYLRRAGRPDLEARSITLRGVALPPTEAWLLTQNSHTCFENEALIDTVSRHQRPAFVHHAGGATTVRVFRMPW